MQKPDFISAIGKLRGNTLRILNDAAIWATAGTRALFEKTADQDFISQKHFSVPGKQPGKKVNRSPEQVRTLLKRAYLTDLYATVIVYLVAKVEAYLWTLSKLRLLSDPRRLKTRVPGIEHINRVEVGMIVDAGGMEELLMEVIERELQSVFYARPAAYFEYFRRVIGFEVDKEIEESWIEIKATRDVLVHNAGIANSIYLEKAGSTSRAQRGEELPVEGNYFEKVVKCAKVLVSQSEARCRKAKPSAHH